MLGSLFLSAASIFFIALTFGDHVKNLNKKLIEIDRINKEINNGTRNSKY